MQSIFRDKLVPVALVAALLGGLVGVFGIGPTMNNVGAAVGGNALAAQAETMDAPQVDRIFTDVNEEMAVAAAGPELTPELAPQLQQTRVVYRNESRPVRSYNEPARRNTVARNETSASHARRARAVNQTASAPQPQKRSFWSKHRDKLTVAGGTGAGALIGGLLGGKKGALIGGLSGAGGSALYTYKIRQRGPRN